MATPDLEGRGAGVKGFPRGPGATPKSQPGHPKPVPPLPPRGQVRCSCPSSSRGAEVGDLEGQEAGTPGSCLSGFHFLWQPAAE